tara:strand:- start:129 stop:245 length:117 start_codon:yes stop_codon:yes gene_type:complete
MRQPTVKDAIKWALYFSIAMYVMLWIVELVNMLIWGYK